MSSSMRWDMEHLITEVINLGTRVTVLETYINDQIREAQDEMHIACLNLPVRAYNALMRNKIKTIGELRELTDEQIYDIPGVGWKTHADIVESLNDWEAK